MSAARHLRALTDAWRRLRYRGQRRLRPARPRLEFVLIIAAGVLIGLLVGTLTLLLAR